jgi:glycerate kinase
MRYLIAPNAFKGTLTAVEAAELIAKALSRLPGSECLLQPVADGGDGTCALLIDSLLLEKITVLTLNAVGQPVRGYFGWDAAHKIAYLDLATASGIGTLEKHQKDPAITSTYGTGILIRKAIDMGAEEVVLGLGGSATVDLGTGILSALGILFLDSNGREIPSFSPRFLETVKHIQRTPLIPRVKFTCLCDVKNPFLGPNGAVSVFGPQKGLERDQIESFETYCRQVLDLFIRRSNRDWSDQAGFGAAGGVAMGLQFFFDTEIKFGAPHFFELVKIGDKLRQSDWVITGEGQYDSQSNEGKASFELLKLAKANDKKIALITSGSGGAGAGFDLVLEVPPLDFSSPVFIEDAKIYLQGVIDDAIAKGKLN